MARYTVRVSYINVVGRLWQPGIVAAIRINLRAYDIENMRQEAIYRNDDPTITREVVECWLATNSGDFQEIIDFEASIEDGDQTLDFPFATEDGEMAYVDCFSYPEDE